MKTAIKNIHWENTREFGRWGIILTIISIPIWIFAKTFGIQNKSYEKKDYH